MLFFTQYNTYYILRATDTKFRYILAQFYTKWRGLRLSPRWLRGIWPPLSLLANLWAMSAARLPPDPVPNDLSRVHMIPPESFLNNAFTFLHTVPKLNLRLTKKSPSKLERMQQDMSGFFLHISCTETDICRCINSTKKPWQVLTRRFKLFWDSVVIRKSFDRSFMSMVYIVEFFLYIVE